MADLTATVPLSGVVDFAYDNSRGLLYLVTSAGQFYAWNPSTGSVVGSVALGGAAGAMALTPDGRYAIVGEANPANSSTDVIDKIDLFTLADQQLPMPAAVGMDLGVGQIAINQSGTAVFASVYDSFLHMEAVEQFYPEAAVLRAYETVGLGGSFTGEFVASSPGTDLVLVKENSVFQVYLELLNPETGSFTFHQEYDPGASYTGGTGPRGDVTTSDAISAAAGLVADISFGNIRVYDFNFNQVADLTSQIAAPLSVQGAQFSANGHQLFLWHGQNIDVFDTQLWTQVGVLPAAATLPTTPGDMITSGDGRFLFFAYGSTLGANGYVSTGFQTLDLSAQLHLTVQGDGVHTQLFGAAGADTITGSAANETIDGGGGNDVLDGGGGINTVSFASAPAGVTVSLALQGLPQNTGGSSVTLSNFQNLTGSAFNDTLEGDGGNNILDGGAGTNTVSYAHAAAGVSVSLALQGQAQNTGGAGIDTLSNFQNLTGSAFNDTLEGDGANNVLDGGGGINTVSYAHASAGVSVSLALGYSMTPVGGVPMDTLVHFQNVTGSAFDDTIEGDAGDNVLDGGSGTNTLSYAHLHAVTVSLALQGQAQNTGGAGTDTFYNFQNLTGSGSNDTLEGDAGDNVLDGGTGGYDTVSYAHAGAGVTVHLGVHGPQNTVGAGTDTLSGFQAIIGSAYNDTLEAVAGPGGFGTLTGGGGADTFVYKSSDGTVTITDFSDAQGDRIDLSSSTKFGSLSDLLPNMQQPGSDTYIQLQTPSLHPQYLVLQGVSLASLTASDFIFGPSVGPGIGGTPTAGSGTLNGTAASDWLQGGSGADTLHGGGGSDYLDGGAGVNTAAYDGIYRQYTVSPGASPETVGGGPEGGMDDLANIQRIQFVDGYLATSPTDTAGQVYRVYEATLGRAPDQVGLANWVHSLNGGMSLQTVVNGFVGSQEFQALYGSLDNTAFVTLLYHNVLHRDPDAQGLSNWVNTLNTGHSRAEVVTGFSESQEDIAALAAPVQQGLWIEDAAAAQAARLYDTVFGRLPDAQGLINWTHSLESGTSLQTAAAGFVASQEFQQVYGSLDNTAFLTLLYHNVLHRDPDASGLANWQATLAKGTSRAEVVMDFSESQEHVGNLAPHIDYGVWVAG